MIVRRGINVKYSHDEEALIAWMAGLREFTYATPYDLTSWLDPLRPYSYSATYFTNEDGSEFDTLNNWWMYTNKHWVRRVDLWKPQDTARRLIEDHGFSCVICGQHAKWDSRGDFFNWNIHHALRDRQEVEAPTLICSDCSRDVYPLLIWPTSSESLLDEIIHRLAGRLKPLSSRARVMESANAAD